MGEHRVVNLVLRRDGWGLEPAQAGRTGAAREALIEQMLAHRACALRMPAWHGEPELNAHIVDLYAYLLARAEGAQGPGR